MIDKDTTSAGDDVKFTPPTGVSKHSEILPNLREIRKLVIDTSFVINPGTIRVMYSVARTKTEINALAEIVVLSIANIVELIIQHNYKHLQDLRLRLVSWNDVLKVAVRSGMYK